jgi:hypothetical protein
LAPYQPFQLSNACLFLAALLIALEYSGRVFDELGLPARKQLRLQTVSATHFCRALAAADHFHDNLGFELS